MGGDNECVSTQVRNSKEAALRESGRDAKERCSVTETFTETRGESISQAKRKFKAASEETRTETSGGSAILERDKPGRR